MSKESEIMDIINRRIKGYEDIIPNPTTVGSYIELTTLRDEIKQKLGIE